MMIEVLGTVGFVTAFILLASVISHIHHRGSASEFLGSVFKLNSLPKREKDDQRPSKQMLKHKMRNDMLNSLKEVHKWK